MFNFKNGEMGHQIEPSHSNQCFTTGVTKAMVYDILSVKISVAH